MRWPVSLFLFLLVLLGGCRSEQTRYAVITTGYGDIKIRLYDRTPNHRDNFIKLVEEEYYDYTMFHRARVGFVIQGGDPDSKTAGPLDNLGGGGLGYLLEPEIGAIHVKGAVAAARQPDEVNPGKKSSACQFYIVQGMPVGEQELNEWEAKKGIKYTPEQRALYREKGGLPFLDMEYTVFGEVVEGMDIVDKIAGVPVGRFDRPTEDIRMKVRLVNE